MWLWAQKVKIVQVKKKRPPQYEREKKEEISAPGNAKRKQSKMQGSENQKPEEWIILNLKLGHPELESDTLATELPGIPKISRWKT